MPDYTDSQLQDIVLNALLTRLGTTDKVLVKLLTGHGIGLVRAEDAVWYTRKWLKANKFNPARLQRSVGSDSYVDGQTKRSTI